MTTTTYDLGFITLVGNTYVLPASLPQDTELITGTVKLAQRVLLELFTEVGSIPHLPLRGSSFAQRLRLGSFGSELDVFASLAAGAAEVFQNLTGDETEDDSDTERLRSIQISRLAVTDAAMVATLTVISRAQTSVAIAVLLQLHY